MSSVTLLLFLSLQLSPKFLHTNSTSHTWPFSAIAELIDNAYDPDANAKQFWIDKTCIKGHDCLTFVDNGAGMNYDKMYKMLSFGFSDKQTINGHIPVGLYGNGFKSGSMRLGKDAIVFSKSKDSMNVGLLSQSYLEEIKAQNVVVPIVTFRHTGQNRVAPEHVASLKDILRYSLFNTESELLSELQAINATSSSASTGTRIIIWNLRRMANGQPEFDFNIDKYDIQIPADVYETTSEKYKRQDRPTQSVPESDYSLRAYCSILYLKPRMHVVIRGQKVKTQLISKSLAFIAKDHYRPIFLAQSKRIPITFGYNTKSKDQYGIMMYHKNRLIKGYERVGCQLKANNKGVGVIGVIECNFLKPTHNKQDFDYTDEYRKTINNLGIKLEEYWNEIRFKQHNEDPNCEIPVEDTKKRPDQNWVQCDDCLKWRKLPDGIDCDLLPDKWFCHMNPDPQFRSCHVEEEPEDSDDDQPSYQKTYKQHTVMTADLKERLLLEAQQQQDKLMEMMQSAAHERDAYKEQVHQLTCKVEDLEGQLLELRQTMVKKELSDQSTETEWQDEGPPGCGVEDVRELRALYQQAKQEVEELKQEHQTWGAAPQGRASSCLRDEEEEEKVYDEDELALQVDSLFRDLDRSNKEIEELKAKLQSMETEKHDLSSQCEKLKEELELLRVERADVASAREEGTQKLNELRRSVGRLLVTFVPALELEQVNYDCEVIDEILDQVIEEVNMTGDA
uniref:MORC family CW-type zinc finger 3a n=1 Tax=Scleropages formosus TaxID=113540 RepID=A0A8D0CNF7_SCLFO